MANNITNVIVNGLNSAAISYTTASVTPGANQLMLLAVTNSKAGTPDIPTVAGNSLTWVQVATVTFNTIASPTRRLTLFRALGAGPSTGTIVISFGGVSQLSCTWVLDTVSGMLTTGANGADAVVQSAVNNADTGLSLAVALAAFSNAGNSTYACFSVQTNNTFTEKAGYTELADFGVGTTPIRTQSEWIVSNDTSPNSTQSGNRTWGGIAIEIASAGTTLAAPTATGSGAFSSPDVSATLLPPAGALSAASTIPILSATLLSPSAACAALLLIPIISTGGETILLPPPATGSASLPVPTLGGDYLFAAMRGWPGLGMQRYRSGGR